MLDETWSVISRPKALNSFIVVISQVGQSLDGILSRSILYGVLQVDYLLGINLTSLSCYEHLRQTGPRIFFQWMRFPSNVGTSSFGSLTPVSVELGVEVLVRGRTVKDLIFWATADSCLSRVMWMVNRSSSSQISITQSSSYRVARSFL